MDAARQAHMDQVVMRKADEFLACAKDCQFSDGLGELYESAIEKLSRSELCALLTTAFVVWGGPSEFVRKPHE